MKFTYNPRIIKHLGTELITSDEIAITELVKNSYDAKADKVRIQFADDINKLKEKELLQPIAEEIKKSISESNSHGIILLEDNGIGMDYDTLQKGFFEIGSTTKVKQKNEQKEADKKGSIILGDKGIGRLSAQRLSPILFVETTSKEDKDIHFVKVEWEKFIDSETTDAPELKIPLKKDSSYTRLWFIGTEKRPLSIDHYFETKTIAQPDIFGNPPKDLKTTLVVNQELQSALSFLYSPFNDKHSIVDIKIFRNDKHVQIDFNYDTLKISEAIHSFYTHIIKNHEGHPIDLMIEMDMTIRPWFIERIHHREVGKILYKDWKLTHKEYKKVQYKYSNNYKSSLSESILLSELIEKKNWPEKVLDSILEIAPIEGKIYSFKRDNFLMRMAADSALENNFIPTETSLNTDIRPFLDAHNGIKLYRNDFRIGTIGNKDNDWLQLQQKRTSGQQFYRFELGNVIGFIKINDVYQDYIYETSSREHLTGNKYVNSLQKLMDYILDVFSPGFTKRAVEITKNILDQEGLIPKNDSKEIKKEVDRSNEILKAAVQNMDTIRSAFIIIDENIDLDTEEKRISIKKTLKSLKPVTEKFIQNLSDTKQTFTTANRTMQVVEADKKRIEVEAYNNYKLMANGLITEVITHELHSLVSDDSKKQAYENHFEAIKNYLFEVKNYQLNKEHLNPLHKRFQFLHNKMGDLERFYAFLEKTFIYRGNSHDFIEVDIAKYLESLKGRFEQRLTKNKIGLEYSTISNKWYVPKGSLMHLFYNLIDNSIYWIQQRQTRAKHDLSLKREGMDEIIIRNISPEVIHYYDTGTGVLEKYQHILFNPLESGKENGRGMGLYIVRNFLRSFGGDIELLPNLNEYGNRYIFEIRINTSNEEK